MSTVQNPTASPVLVPVCPSDHPPDDDCPRVLVAPGAYLIFADSESNGPDITAEATMLGLTPVEL